MTSTNNTLEEEIEEYDFYIKLNPRYETAFYKRAIAKYKLKRYQEALEDFDRAIYLYSSYAKAYYYRGIVKEALNHSKEAKKDFEKAANLNPTVEKDIKKDDV